MPKILDALAITTAQSGVASAPVSLGTAAAGGLAIQIDFAYGSGGTSGTVWLQTSLDGGATFFDIASMSFLVANKSRLMALSSRTPITTPRAPVDGTLANDTVVDGILGLTYRTKLTTVGTYAGTTLSVNVVATP